MMKHLACIMDGNRRWAKRKGWLPWYGHREGVKAMQRVVDFCLSKSIRYLSLYTFSIENFKRPEQETKYLFSMLIDQADEMLKNCTEKNVQIRFIGDRDLFPERLLPTCQRLEAATQNNTALQLNMLFCYGGRQEMTSGVKDIVKKVQAGELAVDDICQETITQNLWLHDAPEPDLIIRTGGAKRLSNFLLYQAAYAELCFFDCMWPEITSDQLQGAFDDFDARQRNFGT